MPRVKRASDQAVEASKVIPLGSARLHGRAPLEIPVVIRPGTKGNRRLRLCTRPISLRATERERAALECLAQRNGLSASRYLRWLLQRAAVEADCWADRELAPLVDDGD